MLVILNRKLEGVGVLTNDSPQGCPYYNDVHTEALENNLSVLEFDVPAIHPTASLLENEGYVVYTDLDGIQNLFVIKEIGDSHGDEMTKNVYCEHAAVGDLLGNIVRPVMMNSYSLQQAMDVVLDGTDWSLGIYQVSGSRDINIDSHQTSLQALHEVVNAFGAEMRYRVVFDGSSVRGRFIDVVERRGEVTNKIFEYSKDLTAVERVEDTKSLVTALIGIGKDGLKLNGYLPPADPRFQLLSDYVADLESYQKFNRNGKHIFGVFECDADNVGDLYSETVSKLKELSAPKLTFKCDIVTLSRIAGYEHEKVRLGDTIVVEDFSYSVPIVVEARVVELKTSKSDKTKDEVVLGDYRPIKLSNDASIERLQKRIREQEDKIATAQEQVQVLEQSSETVGLLLNGNITSENIQQGSVTAESLAPATITKESGVIAPNAITATEIADAAIGKNQIAIGTIDETHIASNAIKAEHIGQGVISADNLQDGIITDDKIALGEISAKKLNLSSHILT